MYKFTKTRDVETEGYKADLELKIDTEHLEDLIFYFEDFLRGSGFVIDGTLKIVEDSNDRIV